MLQLRSGILLRTVVVWAVLLLASPWARAQTAAADIADSLRGRFLGLADPTRTRDGELAALSAFYSARRWAPVWSGGPEAQARGRAVLGALEGADRDGLSPAAYEPKRLALLLARSDVEGGWELELALSRQALRYARDLEFGRLPMRRQSDVPTGSAAFDPIATLKSLVDSPDPAGFLAGLAPSGVAYLGLRDQLASLRKLAAAGGWTSVPDGAPLKAGDHGVAVGRLRWRLLQSQDLPAEAAGTGLGRAAAETYDATLGAAVRRFQERHGLTADGVAGAGTLKALNVPLATRLDQVIVNLDRERQLRPDWGTRYVWINIPDYRLRLVDAAFGQVDGYESRVVVGTIDDPTPSFTSEMTYLELNPYWHVPRSIAVKEFLPKIQQDTSYLERNDYVLTAGGSAIDPAQVDWSAVGRDSFHYRIKQKPGERNALGRVKFMFPNEFNVYVHDTPSKGLFARTQRTFSHGCVRLADPFDLAERLLGPQGWDKARIKAALDTGQNRVIRLERPLPVYITYRTAWVDADGKVAFRNDIYGRDADRLQELGKSQPFADPILPLSLPQLEPVAIAAQEAAPPNG